MSNPIRSAFVLAPVLACILVFAPLHASSQTGIRGQQPARMGSVSGRITIHGKGAPGIVVMLRNSDFSPQPTAVLKATTDQDGNYRITDIPVGSYQVSPMGAVYIVSDVGRARAKTILLAQGEDVPDIDFSVIRGGVITGKITDADGRPVIETTWKAPLFIDVIAHLDLVFISL